MGKRTGKTYRKILDMAMTVLMVLAMSYQATGNLFHELAGVLLLLQFLCHNLLNRRWYRALPKGRYSSYRRMLTAYGEAKEAVRLEEETLETERQSLLALEESTRAKENSLNELMTAKTAQLDAYEAQISRAEGELDQYNADIAAQEQLMQEIEAELRRREEEARKQAQAQGQTYETADLGNISFIWPCPSSSRITSSFGDRESPTEGASSNHKGVDIGASTGSDILAAAGGQVPPPFEPAAGGDDGSDLPF